MVNSAISLKPVVGMPYSPFKENYGWEIAHLPPGDFLPLSGLLTLPEIGVVMAQLLDYNHETTLVGVLSAETLLLPGGVGVYQNGQPHIMPGCCCGLECWREWEEFAESGKSPWCGHDPEATLAISEELVTIDQILYNETKHATIVLRSFREELVTVEKSLQEFLASLEAWADTVGFAEPDMLAAKFNECFYIHVRW